MARHKINDLRILKFYRFCLRKHLAMQHRLWKKFIDNLCWRLERPGKISTCWFPLSGLSGSQHLVSSNLNNAIINCKTPIAEAILDAEDNDGMEIFVGSYLNLQLLKKYCHEKTTIFDKSRQLTRLINLQGREITLEFTFGTSLRCYLCIPLRLDLRIFKGNHGKIEKMPKL